MLDGDLKSLIERHRHIVRFTGSRIAACVREILIGHKLPQSLFMLEGIREFAARSIVHRFQCSKVNSRIRCLARHVL